MNHNVKSVRIKRGIREFYQMLRYVGGFNGFKQFYEQTQQFISSKGKPNGIAPLNTQGLVPPAHLPEVYRREVIYSQALTDTSSYIFQLTGINLTKYSRVTIQHSAPHSCTSTFYINNKAITSISTTGLVSLTITNNTVTGTVGGVAINPVTISSSSNSTFNMEIIGYIS